MTLHFIAFLMIFLFSPDKWQNNTKKCFSSHVGVCRLDTQKLSADLLFHASTFFAIGRGVTVKLL